MMHSIWLTHLFLFGDAAANVSNADCILNCGKELVPVCLPNADTYLHLPIVVRIKTSIGFRSDWIILYVQRYNLC